MKIELKNLTKSFPGITVLKNLDLKLDDVKSLVLIGPSGGGKTTLLRILAGLEKPSSGKVFVNDKEVIYDEKNLREYRKHIGMVFQSYNLFPHLTALENIVLPLVKVHGYTKEDATERGLKLLERFHLREHANKKPIQLSGGQQQRVAICRAVSIKPEFLLLDEPTSALDPEYTSEVLELIDELHTEGMRLILVTHEMGFAHKVAEKILFISDQKISAMGTPEDIFEKSNNPRVKKFLQKVLKYG
ncbi:MAG: glutamine ABC transporter ATP-binding protein [Candidatus Cloacimonadota bacterium]|nr:MAG: glutamine ABC transporter ATP-binding protein [Candidatus Cloacimonadota bacterium]PIE79265.1 MAG: glutamine ABC transporter ATP-binding protein [Candidatus Delongbacteria bacterium]